MEGCECGEVEGCECGEVWKGVSVGRCGRVWVCGCVGHVIGEGNERISQGIANVHRCLPGSQTLTVLGERCC